MALAASWFFAASTWPTVLALALGCGFGRTRLVLDASSAGFTADGHQLSGGAGSGSGAGGSGSGAGISLSSSS